MAIFESRAARRSALLAALAVVAALGGLVVLVRTYAPFLTSGAAFRAFVAGYGVYAPLAFVTLQVLQVLLAPIPGQVTGFASGYLFGAFWGSVYSILGIAIGSTLAFWLSRRFGRPFVERVVDADALARFDGIAARAGLPGLFVVFLVPGLPDDVLCFVGGLTDIDLRKLVAVAVVGRTPAFVLVNVSGAGFADGNLRVAVLALLLLVASTAWGYYNRDWLLELVGR
jgi:uncharacterized membrane protein YdjX (TVP38/TMEM64 family)